MTSFNPVTLLLLLGAAVGGLFALPFLWTAINLALVATLGAFIYSRSAMAGLSVPQTVKGLALSLALHLGVAALAYWLARLVRTLAIGGAGLMT